MEVLGGSPVDLILLDIYMKEISGIEFLERTRDASRPPVVVLTAFSSEAIRQESASRGAAAFLVKPVKRRELTQVIHDVLEGSSS
jgi:two-component system CheB/CheR fusion protein